MQIFGSAHPATHPGVVLPAARAVAARHRDRAAGRRAWRSPTARSLRSARLVAGAAGSPRAGRADRVDDLAERLRGCGRSAARRSAAAPPPCRRPRPRTRPRAARGLTHTIRWASRDSRSISRPTSSGSPRSQPSERITTTAPRAMPRRPWRSLNVFSASPIRVPLDQSGAAAAARWIARSGLREPQRAGQPGEARREHERLGVRAGARGAGEELQVGARVGLHRAGDVAQQHEAPAHDAPAPAREADRIAAGAQARAQRPAHVDVLAVAPLLVAARAAQRGGELQARHQPVELRRARAAPARRSACCASSSSSLAIASGTSTSAAPRRRRARRAVRRRAVADSGSPESRGAVLVLRLLGRLVRRRADGLRIVAVQRLLVVAAGAEDREEHRVEGRDLRRVGDEHGARGPVQPPARDRAHERERPREVGRARRRHRHAGVVQAPAERAHSGGRSSSTVSTPNAGASLTAAHELLEAGRADHLLVLAVLEHRAERAVDGRGVERSTPSRLSAASQSIASATPAASARRTRASARRRWRPAPRASPRRP